jgi:hypothetical protein
MVAARPAEIRGALGAIKIDIIRVFCAPSEEPVSGDRLFVIVFILRRLRNG